MSAKRLIAVTGMLSSLWFAAGCANTAEGVKEDTSKDASAVGTAADKTGAAVKQGAEAAGSAVSNAGAAAVNAGENATAAATMTPAVKSAIIRDPVLNDSRNEINVDSGNNMVNLKGHVVDQKMKERATEDAQRELDKKHMKATIHNELAIGSGG